MLKVPHEIQLHITHSCNLTCEGCTHYMNQGHSGMLSLEEAEKWMDNWSNRIIPLRFTLMGGEPALHKDLTKFVYLARKKWENSYIEVISNGFYLKNHPDLWIALKETQTILGVSIHHDSDPVYIEKFKETFKLINEWRDKGAPVELRPSIKRWLRQYKGFGDKMEPYEDNSPKSSWKACVSKLCVQLHEGKLWKCPALAYLPMQAEKYNLSEKWDPYLKYEPLDYYCSEEDLKKFFLRKSESYCSMCPGKEDYFEPESPLLPLSHWKKLYDQ
jgi:organic radical activating enzyme